MTGRISEIFSSIQGEGVYFGVEQVFVRFFDCNLQCVFCDTQLDKFSEYSPAKLLSEIKSYGKNFHSVSFTGGEPLLQKDFLKESLKLVKQEGYRTYLETNGTLPEQLNEVIGQTDIIAMDIKLPSSTNDDEGFWQEHYDFLKSARSKDVFIKAVICLSTTKEDIIRMSELLKSLNYDGVLVLQPNSFEQGWFLERKIEAFNNICRGYNLRTITLPQMHKMSGVK